MDSIKRSFIRMAVLPNPIEEHFYIKLRNVSFGILLLTVELFITISSLALFLKIVVDDLEKSLYVLMQFMAFSCGAYMMAIGYKKRHDIADLFSEIRKIEMKCKKKRI